MKKLSFLLFIVAVTLLQVSCSKKTSGTGGGSGTLKFTINGTNYSYNCSEGAELVLGEVNIDGVGSGNNASSLSFQLQGSASGTYTLGGATNNFIMIYNVPSTNDIYESGHATIVYSQTGSTASATFSGVLYGVAGASDSIVITNGTYSGGYTVAP